MPRRMRLAIVTACMLTVVQVAARQGTSDKDVPELPPLLTAAAFGSLDSLRASIDGGADVNAAGPSGVTALMLAADDPAKLGLLLDRGAILNRTSTDGTTALVAAINRGNVESVRLLLSRGIDTKQSVDQLLQAAIAATNSEVRRVLRDAGVAPSNIGQVAPALNRVDRIDGQLIRELMDIGLDPNSKIPTVTVQVPLLGMAAMSGDADVVRALLDRRADANLATNRHDTPLMLAAASDRPSPSVVRQLLDHGALKDTRDDLGRTALDWALMQGESDMARLLRAAGVPSGPPAASTAAAASQRSLQAAIEAATTRMNEISPAFTERSNCVSCHNQSLPALARVHATARGIAVKPEVALHPSRATLDHWKRSQDARLVGRCGGGGFVQSVGYGLISMAAERVPHSNVTDATVTCLASRQFPDGSWSASDMRPPLGGSPILNTALAIRSLDAYMPPGLQTQGVKRIAKALEFLRRTEARDTQDTAFKLLGFVWGKASPAEIEAQARALAALQRHEGGWGQVPTMAPDAYATGQALFALAVSGMPVSHVAYQRGVTSLLNTQLGDGSWFVRSRGFPFQPYFDYGFPHGTDQFISAAATSWAIIALAQ